MKILLEIIEWDFTKDIIVRKDYSLIEWDEQVSCYRIKKDWKFDIVELTTMVRYITEEEWDRFTKDWNLYVMEWAGRKESDPVSDLYYKTSCLNL